MYDLVTTARAESLGREPRSADAATRGGSLSSALSDLVMERLLDRSDIRMPVRTLPGPTRAVSVAVTVRAVDVGAGPRALEALHQVADLAIANMFDHASFAVIRPGYGPTFLFPLPAGDDPVDEVVALCRQLDEEQLRQRASSCAARLRAAVEHAPRTRDVRVEIVLGEGTIAGAPSFVGMLLPSLAWRPT